MRRAVVVIAVVVVAVDDGRTHPFVVDHLRLLEGVEGLTLELWLCFDTGSGAAVQRYSGAPLQ